MSTVADAIREFLYNRRWDIAHSDAIFSCRVSSDDEINYTAHLYAHGADVVYKFLDVQVDTTDPEYPEYSAIVKLESCTVYGLTLTDEDYYCDSFRKYLRLCGSLQDGLESVDTYWDDRRTYF